MKLVSKIIMILALLISLATIGINIYTYFRYIKPTEEILRNLKNNHYGKR